MDEVTMLGEVTRRAHDDASDPAEVEAVVDLRELRFMDSSCLKQLVSWLARASEAEGPARYRVVFQSNPTVRWQGRSLQALRAFAPDVVTVLE